MLDINPDHVNAAFARAACYNAMGQFSMAIEGYNSALLKDQSIGTPTRPETPNRKSLFASASASHLSDGNRSILV